MRPLFLQLKECGQRGNLAQHIIFCSDRNYKLISTRMLRDLMVKVFDASENDFHADSALVCHFFATALNSGRPANAASS